MSVFKGLINHISPPREKDEIIDLGEVECKRTGEAESYFKGMVSERSLTGTLRLERITR